jgi:hypothetical protein
MFEFERNGQVYRARKLNTFQQMHVLRRISPIIGPLFAVQTAEGLASQGKQIGAFLEALGKVSDEDCDFIVKTCASVVQRQQGGNGSGPVWADIFNARANAFMFEDIDNLGAMFDITGRILQDNLGDFLSIRAPGSEMETPLPQPAPATASNGSHSTTGS